MLKFLLITFLIAYLLFKVGGYLFRIFFWSLGGKMQQNGQFNSSREASNMRPPNSNVDIHYVPKDKKEKKEKVFKGGEYVDYEDVK